MIFTITLLAVTMLLGGVIVVLVENHATRSLYHERLDEALGVAEAGLQDAMVELNANPSWNTGFTNKPFQNGFYTVTFVTGIDTAGVTSTGWIPAGNGPDWQVTRVVRTEIGDSQVCVAAIGDVILQNAKCLGDAYAGDDIDLSVGAVISGNADAKGNVTISASTITGKIRAQNYPPTPVTRTFADPDENSYKTDAQAGGTYSGNYNINNQTLNLGPLYITGNLDINNSDVTIMGTIFVEQELEITNSDINVPDPRAVYVKDDIKITNNNSFSIGLGGFALVGSTGEVEIVNDSLERTSVYAPQATLKMTNAYLGGRAVAAILDLHVSTIGGIYVVGLPMPQQFRVLQGTYKIR